TAPALRGCEHRRDDTLPPSAERLVSSVQRMAWRMPAAARGKMPAAPWVSLFARYRLLVTDCSLPTRRCGGGAPAPGVAPPTTVASFFRTDL
ncbi:MAG: hypothetical protein LW835_04990, partial [Burkholderiaceae bacterium]|nr:hypothetical protein [Burkholderiaceae bacterium]